jgi:chromosome segregation ATPase
MITTPPKPDLFGNGQNPQNMNSVSSHSGTFRQQQERDDYDFQRRKLEEDLARQDRERTAAVDDALSASTTPVAPRDPTDSENTRQIKQDIFDVDGKAKMLIDKLTKALKELDELKNKIAVHESTNKELQEKSNTFELKVNELENSTNELTANLQKTTAELEESSSKISLHSTKASLIEQQILDYQRELREILEKTTTLKGLFNTDQVNTLLRTEGGRYNRRSQINRKRRQTNQSKKLQTRSLRQKRKSIKTHK